MLLQLLMIVIMMMKMQMTDYDSGGNEVYNDSGNANDRQ